jgi:hypothetical protein
MVSPAAMTSLPTTMASILERRWRMRCTHLDRRPLLLSKFPPLPICSTSPHEAAGSAARLPHRDVSWWGERDVSPGVVARECLEAVVASDVVVAVMGESFGTHVEVGVALARGIPVVAVRCNTAAESCFALAVAESPWVGVLSVPTLSDMPKTIATAAFHEALHQARASRLGGADGVPASAAAALR